MEGMLANENTFFNLALGKVTSGEILGYPELSIKMLSSLSILCQDTNYSFIFKAVRVGNIELAA